MRPLVIGVGHSDRGDDHVGVEVARQVTAAGPDADVLIWSGPPLSLLDRWQGRHVVLVDAVRSSGGRSPGSVVTLDQTAIASCTFPSSTHDMGVAEVLMLARALGLGPASLTIVGVELARHEVGDGMSREAADAVPGAVAEVLACLDALSTVDPRDGTDARV